MIWKPIPGFDGYQASPEGQISSSRPCRGTSDRILQSWTEHGYQRVCLMLGGRRSKQWVHRLIALAFLDPPAAFIVDHKNGNRSDNAVGNLRLCSSLQNAGNAIARGGSSQYKGVSYDQARGKWFACIARGRKTTSLGRFDDEMAAAAAYDVAAAEHFGEFAKLNFPRNP